MLGLALVCNALAAVAMRQGALGHSAVVRAPAMPRAEIALKLSKRMALAEKSVDSEKLYTPEEALAVMMKVASTKFVETAEAHIRLNIDPKYNDQQIRTTVSLPKGTGKTVRVAVLADGAMAEAARAAGADLVGMDDLVESISKGDLDFDVLVATPPAMPKIAKLGRVLGPKGLMPSPKAGTVTTDVASAVAEFKSGKFEFRCDKQGIVHVPFGKLNFAEADLLTNLKAVQETVDKNKPTGSKGKFWSSLYICSSMGPSMQVDIEALTKMVSVV
ncbi:50S ribosomal protein L1 [Pavlovales sp. CCMP2436]|nr:50S ribosomal protein L1 [Pavlovales sp. CCMP2436]|mmetsp:Transcript_5715/g.14924  ORF Transcript_5715/g.14924 Transcript_5715/m.14924 type:complete len:274 (+) Transcript_5715:44-865(+)